MRLLTYNSLKSNYKHGGEGFPLKLEITKMAVRESAPNLKFIKEQLPHLEWSAVLVAAEAVGLKGLPLQYSDELLEDESFLVAMHNLLMDIHVETGILTCPETGRTFPIVNGLADMIIPETEVA